MEYSQKWDTLTFGLSNEETAKETFSFPIKKVKFIEPEIMWGGGVGSPTCNKNSHGLNAAFFKKLVEYAHSMIADELRGD